MPGMLFPQGGRFISEERQARFGLRRRVDSLIRSSGHRRGRTAWAFLSTWFGTPALLDQGSGRSSPGPRRVLSECGMTGVWLTWPAGASQPRPEGVEPPTVGSEVRCHADVNAETTNDCESQDSVLPDSLPDSLQNDPDLASVVDAWATLPKAVRAGIVAMVRAFGVGTSATADGGEA